MRKTVLSASVRVFSVRLAPGQVALRKQITLTKAVGHHLICLGPQQNEETAERIYSLLQLGHPSSAALRHQHRVQDWHHRLPWFSGLGILTGSIPPAFLGLQLAKASWHGTSLHNCMIQSFKISICVYMYLYTHIGTYIFICTNYWLFSSVWPSLIRLLSPSCQLNERTFRGPLENVHEPCSSNEHHF